MHSAYDTNVILYPCTFNQQDVDISLRRRLAEHPPVTSVKLLKSHKTRPEWSHCLVPQTGFFFVLCNRYLVSREHNISMFTVLFANVCVCVCVCVMLCLCSLSSPDVNLWLEWVMLLATFPLTCYSGMCVPWRCCTLSVCLAHTHTRTHTLCFQEV